MSTSWLFRGGDGMATILSDDLLGLIDSTKGEIVCRECLEEEQLNYVAEEEMITKDKMGDDDAYICNRCNKEL
jgi:superfamily II helicase